MHMDERTFKQYMRLARDIEGPYRAGYIKGIRRHYYGEQYQIEPIAIERLPDISKRGAEAVGFLDGIAGQKPAYSTNSPDSSQQMTTIHFELPKSMKSSYVRAAQAQDMKLIPWIISACNARLKDSSSFNSGHPIDGEHDDSDV